MNMLVHFFTTETPSAPRSYEYKGLQYSWRSSRLGGKMQDYLLEMALAQKQDCFSDTALVIILSIAIQLRK